MYVYVDDSSLEGDVWLWSVMGTLEMNERRERGREGERRREGEGEGEGERLRFL